MLRLSLAVLFLIINPMWTRVVSVWTMNETHVPNSSGQIGLNWTPIGLNSTACYKNGVRLSPGNDYTLNGQIITALAPSVPFAVDDVILCDYYH